MQRKYYFRKDRLQIIFFDTMEVLDLNETAAFVFERFEKNVSKTEIVLQLLEEYEISEHELDQDVE